MIGVFTLFMALLGLFVGAGRSYAQEGSVQRLVGFIQPDKRAVYVLPDLQRGQVLYIYATGTSGNLDPFVALADASRDPDELRDRFAAEVGQALAAGQDPLKIVPDFADRFFLAWDDDGGAGYDAAFEFTVPTDGDYILFLGDSPQTQSFGDYQLLIGLDAPEVLTGEAKPSGDRLAILDRTASRLNVKVDEITDTLTTDKRRAFYTLNDVVAGDTIYVFVEATSGDLAPIVLLSDFGGKPLSSGNLTGEQSSATLQYTIEADGRNYRLRIDSCCDDGPLTSGDYRLLIGHNEPDVLTGRADPTVEAVIQQPIEVQVGMKMEQISGVDQKAENFGAVVDMRMEWTDKRLAFSPDSCQCQFQTFTPGSFEKFMSDKGVNEWPSFTLFNQQGRRDSQNQLVAVFPDGRAIYVERFSATLQAPDFNFKRFPFDEQQFFIRVRLVFPQEFFVYSELEGFSDLGQQLGEEEWIVTNFDTTVDSHNGSSRFSFGFEATRHLNFYIFRFFVPVLIIIVVSWTTFFLKDYGKRIDVASANLLLFIAFNFTISNDLPRLGYLTFMDTILVSTFVVTGLVVVFNVYLKRLEVTGKESFAQSVDKYMIWIYPLAYFIAFVAVTLLFT
jgi:hypothetical protein